jgi:hypothetical protein
MAFWQCCWCLELMLLVCFPLFLLRRLYLLTWHMGEWQAWMA